MTIAWKNTVIFQQGDFQLGALLHNNSNKSGALEKVNFQLEIVYNQDGINDIFNATEEHTNCQKVVQNNNGLYELRLLNNSEQHIGQKTSKSPRF